MAGNFQDKVQFIKSVHELLRGDYKQSDYQKVVLPFTVLRRLDCVTEPTKEKVRKEHERLKKLSLSQERLDPALKKAAGAHVYNTSKFTFATLLAEPEQLPRNLRTYINGFSPKARDILEHFDFETQIDRLDKADLLFLVLERFAAIDLHPDTVPNEEMGTIYEELVRWSSELSNEEAGHHFTPREVIELMVNLLFIEDADVLQKKGVIKTLYDPACGTGGMLSVAERHLKKMNAGAKLHVFGQELNGETYAVCNSDMLLKGQDPERVVKGNSFSEDGHEGRTFDYMLCNPPFGVEWKKVEAVVREEAKKGHAGRFGAGLPRINDGSFLFLQHMMSKMVKPEKGGSRIAIVFNGSPLFTGGAGSGESSIRRWIIESDWLEAIVALPDNLFYNTGIHTYVWVVTNRKPKERKGKVQLIDAREMYRKMRKSLGDKRHELAPEHIAEITRLYGDFKEEKRSKTFPNEAFGYRRVTVERPLRRNFQASPERIARLEQESAFQALASSKKKGLAMEAEVAKGLKAQAAVKALLGKLDAGKVHGSHEAFEKDLVALFEHAPAGLELTAALRKAIFSALGEPDPEAKPLLRKGQPEPDAELRDYENVPLGEDIGAYFEREVRPHVPDAWVDESKVDEQDGKVGVVGYEVNFNRYFYEYKPPRALEEIDADIKRLEDDIVGLLRSVSN